jgi:ParB family transcriptional regulator, chromosome partitioning protein
MNNKTARRALGRGLSNLIPVTQAVETVLPGDEIQNLKISTIRPNPFQPRLDFDDEEIKGLAESIENQGLLQPVVVRKKDNGFEIISGERRFRAFIYLKRETIPCIVRDKVTDREMLELALVENIQREQLNEIEKAIAYQKLLLECNYTHDELSKQVGKSRSVISNSLRLLNLPDKIQQLLRKDEISMGHARALLSIEDETEQLNLAEKIVKDSLSVRDIEKVTQNNKEVKREPSQQSKKEPVTIDPDIANLLEKLQYKFGTSVSLKSLSSDNGKLEIQYFSQSDLVRIVDLLLA